MRIVFDACNNMLAAEYLFRNNNRAEYNKRIKQLAEIQLNDELMYELHFQLGMNHDYMNIGFMYTCGEFDDVLKILLEYLDATEGLDSLANHGVMSPQEYLDALKKGEIEDENN